MIAVQGCLDRSEEEPSAAKRRGSYPRRRESGLAARPIEA